MTLVRALHRVGRSDGFVVYFVDLAVHFAGDRVMPVLVGFVPAMRRIDSVDCTSRAWSLISSVFSSTSRASCAIWMPPAFLLTYFVGPRRWHRRTHWDCKSAKRNRQRRANENLSGYSLHNAASLAFAKKQQLPFHPVNIRVFGR